MSCSSRRTHPFLMNFIRVSQAPNPTILIFDASVKMEMGIVTKDNYFAIMTIHFITLSTSFEFYRKVRISFFWCQNLPTFFDLAFFFRFNFHSLICVVLFTSSFHVSLVSSFFFFVSFIFLTNPVSYILSTRPNHIILAVFIVSSITSTLSCSVYFSFIILSSPFFPLVLPKNPVSILLTSFLNPPFIFVHDLHMYVCIDYLQL